MRILRIYSKPSGESAIELREVPMSAGARPVSETFRGGAVFFRETPEGHVQDFHNAPRRQLIFLTSGILEVETSEGARYVCRPGDVIFAEDTAGKGHITRSLRDTRSFVHMAMPEDFDVSSWPIAERPPIP
jgi:quercetin dioxygenase-like cupin family protein